MTQMKADSKKGKVVKERKIKQKELKDRLQRKGVGVCDEGEQGFCLTGRQKHHAKINPASFHPNTR